MLCNFGSILEILEYRALEQCAFTSYIFLADGETESAILTYGELDKQARAIAAHLQSMQGERALLLYPSGLEFITAFLGCLYAGVVAVPVYPPRRNHKLSQLLSVFRDAQAKIALTTTSVLADFEKNWFEEPELAELQLIATDTIEANPQEFVLKSITPDSLAFLQYTSGSTGAPKGVMVTHGNIIHNQKIIYQAFGHSDKSIGVCWLPLFHDMGLIGHILQPIYGGCTSVLMPPVAFLQQPVRWLSAISRYKATTSGGPNFAYDLCVKKVQPEQLVNLDLSSWEVAFNGAEPVKAETLKQFSEKFATCGFNNKAFYPCYGMAETTLFATGGDKHQKPVIQGVKAQNLENNCVVESEISSKESRVFVGVGRPCMDTTVIIVNPESLTRSREGQVGEIWIRGKTVTYGYWNRLESTQETFQAYLKDTGEGSFLRTGDLGFFKNGELFITGRLKDVIIINGRNHYPQDIELTIDNSHPALRSYCTAAFSAEIEGEECLVVACEVERTHLRKLNTSEVVRAIQIAVSTEHELEVYAVVLLNPSSIPKTSSGKIQRRACKQGFLEKSLNVVGQWQKNLENKNTIIGANSQVNNQDKPLQTLPKTSGEIEAWLTHKIAEVLQIPSDEIDLKQPLAIYGLNSVKAVSIAAELEEWLGIPITPTIVYDYPSIQALADYLGRKTPPIESSIFVSNQKTATEGIAIVGIGCRFPKANNPQAFWSLLREGVDAITKVPASRWELDNSWGGFLELVDQFDPQFFGISPREAELMDPQQRLLLEVSWEALENAGLPVQRLAGSRSGVFIGISNADYAKLQGNLINTEAYYGTGNAFSIAANRLSYFLDWHAPSFSVDTACSSSLVAVHQACQSLLLGECNLALAGGVNLMLSPQLTLTFSEAKMMAEDGRCKAFDASADGYVRSEGCGVVVLKRLADALADGDNIQAVIRGSAVNQDGLTNGLTAPNGNSQQEVIRLALAKAQVKPNQISYVETHGTGTALGDPIEVNSLKAVLVEDRESNQTCWISSVKTNIGHLEAAAGIAGLIKVVLSLQHAEIPPHLHLQQLNPYIELDKTSIDIPTQLQPWSSVGQPRLAGVSAFGFGGTNAHVVLEEAPVQIKNEDLLKRPVHLLTLSAKTEKTLDDLVQSYQNYLETDRELDIADVCFSANTGRAHFNHRLAIISTDKQELANQLAKISSQEQPSGVFSRKVSSSTKSPKIAFLFTGQGSQYVNMGRQLYETQPVFRRALEQCAQILQSYLDKSLLEVIYPENPEQLNSGVIDETAYTQPAIFAIEYALFKLWESWGIKPDVVMGHSVGEYVAATLAGVFSLEDGLKLIAHRGRLMQQLPSGDEMVAVMASQEQVNTLIAPYTQQVAIAAINGRESVVISGKKEVIQTLVISLESLGIKTKQLQVSHAFHSPLMEPMVGEFRRVAQEITFSVPQAKFVSNVTGQLVNEEITSPEYWCGHILSPVQFAASMKTLEQQSIEVFLEVGSKPILLSMGRHCVSELGQLWLPSLRKEQDAGVPANASLSDWQQMLESLAQLYVGGVAVDWKAFDADYSRKKVVLPTYPFQRQRYWIEQKTSRHSLLLSSGSQKTQFWHPLIGEKLKLAGAKEIRFESYISQNSPQYLQDHRIYSIVIVPASAYLEMALAAGANVLKSENLVLEDVDIEQALILPENEGILVQVVLTHQESDGYGFQIFSCTAKEDHSEAIWTRHASGKVSENSEVNSQVVDLSVQATLYPEQISVSEHYQRYQNIGLEYGRSFQGITQIRMNSTEALGQIELPCELQSQASEYLLHPVLLDSCFQVIGAMFAGVEDKDAYLPVSIKRLRVRGGWTTGLWTAVKVLPKQVLEPELLKADLSLLSETGDEIGQIEGLILKRTDTLALQRLLKQEDVKSWLYQVSWNAQPGKDSSEPDSHKRKWLIFADASGIGTQLAEQLIAKGDSCVLVFVGREYQQITPQNYQINPNALGDYQRLLQDIVSHGEQVYGVVHLWSLLIVDELDVSLEAQSLVCGSGLHLVQALVRYREEILEGRGSPQLWLVTKGAQTLDIKSTAIEVQQTPLWGLGKVIALEHPEFSCKCLDLDPLAEDIVSNLVAELGVKDRENQIAYRQDLRYVARLERYQEQAIAQPFELKMTEYGVLDNLTLIPLTRRSPKAGEVEIQVCATGLNFRDVLNALGMLKEYSQDLGIKSTDDLPFGGECAGKIVAVGVGETNFKVGDEVIAVHAIGSFSSFVVVNADFVVKKPQQLSFEAAATIPVAFTTADYGLRHLAQVKPGDRVLIHAAAGGVGQAAVQIAQLAGATVFATASPSKWDFLKSMGVEHIFNSRNLDFTQQIMEITDGLGVDIVFNSLNGEFIAKSLEVLGYGGRFVEVGKIGIWSHEQVKAHRPDVSYFPFDMLDIGINHPITMRTLLKNLMVGFNSSKLLPLPHKVFSIEKVTDAFRYMAQAKHIGKIVVSQPEISAHKAQNQEVVIKSDATYLITGGLGALGQKVAHWLVTQGARHLVLSGRTAANITTVKEWEELGTQVLVVTADIAKQQDVDQLLHQIDSNMPPLKGIIHAAGLLDDGVLMQQSWERFERVMAPKVLGTWNLHRLTQDLELDLFVCFSSVAALIGSPAQGNYAAANTFMDALMQHRRGLGLPGVSINWGLWSQTGMTAELSRRERERISGLGLQTIEPDKGLQVLAQLLKHSPAQVGVMPMNWSKWNERSTPASISPFLSVFATTTPVSSKAKSAFLEQLKRTSPPARRQLLENHVRAQIAKVLGLSSSEQIEPRTRLFELGIDSLMAVELKSWLEASLDCSLRSTLLFDYPTLEALIDYLATEIPWLGDLASVSEDVLGGVKKMTLASQETTTEVIAVIGMSCRFPGGAVNPEAFWELLQTGVDAITPIPLERWDIGAYYDRDPDAPGKMSTRFGGFVDQAEYFDAQFFGISPREAVSLDPQQRLLLEVSWEALEYANQVPEQLYNSPTGVFIGICTNDYTKVLERASAKSIDAYFGTGNALSVAAGRLSYMLGLTGPSLAIDTACSSSLVSVHVACQSLRQQECRMALAGGVNLILSPETTIAFSKARMLATDGRCKTFDASADGYVRSEGCGIIVLKRLEDALADGDTILAVIRGSAVNQDGASGGLTVPSGPSQEQVIRQALANAQVDPAQISYIEAHGTGTSLGDPIEISALASVFGKVHSQQQPLMVGSVKTNIGHTEGAAGIAGLMKVILALQHQEIPPHLHFQQPNPYIDWENSGMMVVQTPTPWVPSNGMRLAGVSSFGFSGTNAHIVLEEAPQVKVKRETLIERSHHILTLSAKSDKALQELAQSYHQFLSHNSTAELADICFSANTARSSSGGASLTHFNYRLAIISTDKQELANQLAKISSQEQPSGVFSGKVSSSTKSPKIAFLFTGQGSQYVNMGRQLYETQPVFRRALEQCAQILQPYLDKSLLEVIYPENPEQLNSGVIDETAYTQPAIFAIEYALFKLWESWGIKPDVVMGHSVGEYVAATLAGVFSLEDGLKLIAHRGRLMQQLPSGDKMVAVMASQEQVNTLIAPYTQQVAIAGINGSQSVVISGKKEVIQTLVITLESLGIKTKQLQVSHAFHSPLMDPVLADFEKVANQITYNQPLIGLISNITGERADNSIATPDYWVRHIRQPVKFLQSMETLHQEGYEVFLEIGSKPILLGMGRQYLPKKIGLWLPSLRPGAEDWQQMLYSLAKLYLQGVKVNWLGFDQDYQRGKVVLPTYPFQRQRYWVETSENESQESARSSLENKNTPIVDWLNDGNIQQLAQQLEKVGKFSPEQVQFLPEMLEMLVKEHQKQLTPPSINNGNNREISSQEILNQDTQKAKYDQFIEQLKVVSLSERESLLITYIQDEISQVLRVDASQIDVQEPLNTIGLDSLMAVELRNRVQNNLMVEVPIVKFIEQISIVDLAAEVNKLLSEINSVQTDGEENLLGDSQDSDWIRGEL